MTRARQWILGCSAVLVAIPVAVALSPLGRTIIGLYFMKRNVPFDRPHLQAVVEEVKARGVKPGDKLLYRLENMKAPKSLRPRKRDEYFPRGHGVGNVWATREPSGALIVIIETSDRGHAGEYGYAYSEVRPHKTVENLWEIGELEENLICTGPDSKVAENWWEVVTCYMD